MTSGSLTNKTFISSLLLGLALFMPTGCTEDQEPPQTDNNDTMMMRCPPNQVRSPITGQCTSIFTQDMSGDMAGDMNDTDSTGDDQGGDCTMRAVYVDADKDGYGAGQAQMKCVVGDNAPDGFSLEDGDCDDDNDRRAPGELEYCDDVDNNCNNEVNELITCQFYAHTSQKLYLVDPFKKQLVELGNIPDFFDMDTDANGQLYGISTTRLYRFDQGGNQWREVGQHGIPQNNGANGFAILRQGKAFVTAGNELYTIDLNTAMTQRVGAMGGSYKSSGDCVVNKGDVLFMTSSQSNGPDLFVQLDGQNANAFTVGSTGFDQIYALTSAWGTIFGLTGTGQLVKINANTGQGELVHTFNGKVWYGAASSPER